MSSNVRIDIAAEFTGRKEFEKARKTIGDLDGAVTKLSKNFLKLYGTGKLISFAKQAAVAFADDQKSVALLANTVKNLGLSFSGLELEKFVQKLQNTSGVLDQDLRPALQKLLQTTGSVVKSEQLLTQAVDIARGSGQDLGTVVSDLAAAYVGNTRGLKKYAIGLTQAELKAMSFTDIQKKLNEQFSGSSAAYLDTYAGKLSILSVAADNAKETIGAGLIDAFAALSGGSTTEDAIKNIDAMAKGLADIVRLAGQVGSVFKGLYDAFAFVGSLGGLLGANGSIARGGAAKVNTNRSSSPAGSYARSQAAKAAEAAATKRAKELAAAQVKQTKALKEQSLLKKQGTLFDIQQIELVAALKEKLSKEDRDRVLLQLAILQGNEDEAARLSTQIANSIDKTGQLAKYLQTLPDANNPFKSWQAYLDGILSTVNAISAATGASTVTGLPKTASQFDIGGHEIGSLVPNFTPPNVYGSNYGLGGSQTDSAASVVVQIDGKTIATAIQDQSLSGNNTKINRGGGGFQFL